MTELSEPGLAARLARIVVAPDGDNFILGRADLAIYVVVPEPGAVLVQSLQNGDNLSTAVERASEAAGEVVDGEDFLAGLADAGLLDDTSAGDDSSTDSGSVPVRWIEGVSPATAQRLFGKAAWTFYGLAAAFAFTVLLVRPDLRPNYQHSWWLPDPVLSLLSLAVVGYLTTALHEAWHWLAGRAIGVPAIFRISYRGIFLVFETDLTQIVTVPRRRRYSPFLAGMAFDATLLAAAVGLRLAHRADLIALAGWLDRLLAALVLVHLLRIIWQWAALFMRSDGYAVLANALRCHDLYRATWLITKDRLWHLNAADELELASISPRDRRVARVFGFGYLAGLIVMVWIMANFTIPFLISMMLWVGHNLINPLLGSVIFWESVAVVTLIIGQYTLIPILASRERRRRQRGTLR